jgi:protein associated with RNAse G/E
LRAGDGWQDGGMGTPGAGAAEAGLVQVDYRKYDGALHWNLRMRRLGEDEHGVWLGLPAGGVTRKGHGPAVELPEAHVLLFPRAAWWTATFNAAPRSTEIYCDITTPPQWPAPDEVTMVDLDLDVLLRRSAPGPVLVDEDEFAEHRVRYGYPADVVSAAQESAQWLMDEIAAARGPFCGVHREWLGMVDGGGA